MDRNEVARRDLRQEQAQREFQRLVAAGRAGLLDDLGTRIEAGHLVVYAVPPNTWRWLVKSIEPDLRPNVPVGTMRMVVTTEIPLYFPTGSRLPQILVVGDQRTLNDDEKKDNARNGATGVNGEPDATERPEPAAAPPTAD